jgi:hypothetical protein
MSLLSLLSAWSAVHLHLTPSVVVEEKQVSTGR